MLYFRCFNDLGWSACMVLALLFIHFFFFSEDIRNLREA